MNAIVSGLGLCFVLSLVGNLLLIVKLKNKRSKREDSVELREFITDLMGGTGLLAVTRIDPASILLRSPKQR